MPNQTLVALGGFAVALGLPGYYFVRTKRAQASLRQLVAERFTERPCKFPDIPTGRGPVRLMHAYDDRQDSGLVLLVGYWRRSRKVYNTVAGVFKPGGDGRWMDRLRGQPAVLVTAPVEGGAVAVWEGLPWRASVLAHIDAAR